MRRPEGRSRPASFRLLARALLSLAAMGLLLHMLPGDFLPDALARIRFIRQERELSFGLVNKPNSGTNTYDLHWSNNTVTVTGAGSGFYIGDASSGSYRVFAHPQDVIFVSSRVISGGGAGITFNTMYVNGPTDGATVVIMNRGFALLDVGGSITVSSSASMGDHSFMIEISANYE